MKGKVFGYTGVPQGGQIPPAPRWLLPGRIKQLWKLLKKWLTNVELFLIGKVVILDLTPG